MSEGNPHSGVGGHLGPNLGVVELTVALHRVFNTPKDKILFDVSHQVYVHKMLTPRGPSGRASKSDPPVRGVERLHAAHRE